MVLEIVPSYNATLSKGLRERDTCGDEKNGTVLGELL